MQALCYFLYYIGWSIAVPVLVLAAKTLVPKWEAGLDERLGKLNPEDFPELASGKPGVNFRSGEHLQGPIWFHAVSVGELNALIPLLKFFAGLRLVLTVTTQTARQMAENKLADDLEHNRIKLFYMPWDHPEIVRNVLMRVKPSALILMESEIWPGLLTEAKQLNIPTAIINAKISDKSHKLYQALSFFFVPIFQKIDLVLAQSPADSRKYISMHLDKHRIFMTGNIKFSALPNKSSQEAESFRELLGYRKNDLVIACGSTHEEEEALLVAIFQELKSTYPNIRLILAPRHPERFNIVTDIINSAAKLEPIKLSLIKKSISSKIKLTDKASITDILKASTQEISSDHQEIESANEVLLVDTIGDLMDIYALANIAIVGGTINETVGGHNVLEPASCGIPVLIGPHYHKNRFVVETLEEAGGLIIAETKEDIRIELEKLILNADKRILMGAEAKSLTEKHRKISYDVAEKIKSKLLHL